MISIPAFYYQYIVEFLHAFFPSSRMISFTGINLTIAHKVWVHNHPIEPDISCQPLVVLNCTSRQIFEWKTSLYYFQTLNVKKEKKKKKLVSVHQK